MSNRKLTSPVIVGAIALALMMAPTASAHVTLQPTKAPAGDFTRLDVRVPNERDDKGTTKVDVQFPAGIPSVSYEPVAGWRVKVSREKLDTPLEQHGEKITEQVSRVTWTGEGEAGRIGPGQFRDFGLSLQVPDKAGTKLTFKALQTYEGGEVVRWIGPPDGEEPAPQVEVTASTESEHGEEAKTEDTGGAAGTTGAEGAEGTATASTSKDDDDEDDDMLTIVALVVGGLGLVTGGAALVRSRRR